MPPKKIPYFKMGKELKALLNGQAAEEEPAAALAEPPARSPETPQRRGSPPLRPCCGPSCRRPRPARTRLVASLIGLPALALTGSARPAVSPAARSACAWRLLPRRHADRGRGPRAPGRPPQHRPHVQPREPPRRAGPVRRAADRLQGRRQEGDLPAPRLRHACLRCAGFIAVDRSRPHPGQRGPRAGRPSRCKAGAASSCSPRARAVAHGRARRASRRAASWSRIEAGSRIVPVARLRARAS